MSTHVVMGLGRVRKRIQTNADSQNEATKNWIGNGCAATSTKFEFRGTKQTAVELGCRGRNSIVDSLFILTLTATRDMHSNSDKPKKKLKCLEKIKFNVPTMPNSFRNATKKHNGFNLNFKFYYFIVHSIDHYLHRI